MSTLFRREDFQPFCPSGGTFYVCSSGSNFVGCCRSSTCADACSDGNLLPASFNAGGFDSAFHDQSCPSGSKWYTCATTHPPFLGCCKSNPCGNGCPDGDLAAGFLSSNPQSAAQYLSYASSATKSSISTATGGSSTTTSSASKSPGPISTTRSSAETSAAAQPVVASSDQRDSHTGAIAGGVVGGIIFLITLGALLLFYRKQKARTSTKPLSELDAPPEKPTPMYTDGGSLQSGMHDQKLASQQETPYSTPAPRYPHSSPLPEYPSSPTAEMDGDSQFKPHPALYTGPTHTSYSSQNPLGINPVVADQRPYSAGYVAYKPSAASAVQAPLVQHVGELEGTSAPTSPVGHAMSDRPSMIVMTPAD